MIYKRFYFRIILQVVLLLLTCVLLSEALRSPRNIYTLVVITGFLAIQILYLIYYINSVNRNIARFFEGIQDQGSFVRPRISFEERSFRDLSDAANRVSELIRASRFETEKQLKYFEFVVENNPAGMLILNNNNEIIQLNKAAKQLLKNENIPDLGSLGKAFPGFADEIHKLKHGDQTTIKIKTGNEIACLLLKLSCVRSENEELRIISFHNVVNELEENELVSWQKLTGVLTHEMMNSLTPISSLTLAAKKCLSRDGKPKSHEEIDNESINDALLNLTLIEERGQGLKNFVSNFRRISQMPVLNLGKVNLGDLIERIALTYSKMFEKEKITLSITGEDNNMMLELDAKLIEQALINILMNSVESLSDSEIKNINIRTYLKDHNTIVEIADTGKGISEDIIDNIFVPFFTTKKDGMGVGLSLVQKIMRLHRGKVAVESNPGAGTRFSLIF